MDFKKFLNEEKLQGDNKSSNEGMNYDQLHRAVPHIWTKYIKNGKDINQTLEIIDQEFKELPEVNKSFVKNVVKSLEEILIEPLSFVSSGHATISLSNYWKNLLNDIRSGYVEAVKKTKGNKPKTGIVSPSGEFKIAFHKPQRTPLFFGRAGEAYATLVSALEEMGEHPEQFKELEDLLRTKFKSFPIPKVPKGELGKGEKGVPVGLEKGQDKLKAETELEKLNQKLEPFFAEKGLDINKQEDVAKFVSNDKNVMKAVAKLPLLREMIIGVKESRKLREQLVDTFEDFFNNNENLKAHFIYEALTGEKKFGKDSLGSANYIMTTIPSTGKTKIRKIDFELAKRLVPLTKISLDFKTGGTSGAMGLKFQAPMGKGERKGSEHDAFFGNEAFDAIIGKQLIENAINYSKGEVLKEGLFTNVKKWFSNLMTWLYQKIVKSLKKGGREFLNFLGVKPEIKLEMDISPEKLYKVL